VVPILDADAYQKIAAGLDRIFNGERSPGVEPKIGFVLLVSEFNKIEGGRVNYVSNGERASMIAMLREYLARLEGRVVDPEGGRQ
jgi:hypothetical protein